MTINYHNKIELFVDEKKYTFFNRMLSSVFSALSNKESFSKFVAVGNGAESETQNSFKLTNHLGTFLTKTEIVQNDVSEGICYIKKSVCLSDYNILSNQFITELGLTFEQCENPTIVNYISLVLDDTPNGIFVKGNQQVYLYIYVYLNINETIYNLTTNNNPFVNFLLGCGLNDKIYATRGDCLIENKNLKYENISTIDKTECEFNFNTNNNSLTLNFKADLKAGETFEIVFLIGNEPFARTQTTHFHTPTIQTTTLNSKPCNILDVGKNATSIKSVTNKTNGEVESSYFTKKYASDFGNKIELPFNNIFDADTPRFVSKNADKIFFVIDDVVYGYLNENYQLFALDTSNISIQQVFQIVSFDKHLFVFNNIEPFISCFILNADNIYEKVMIETNDEFLNILHNAFLVDVVSSKNNKFLISIIDSINNFGNTFYFEFDETINYFYFKNHLTSEYKFSYLLAMHKNNFTDARIMFVKEGEYSNQCKIVTHFSDESIEDIYTVLGYFYTKDTKEAYVKNRGVIVEKTTKPHLKLFYYPQMYEYELPLISDEDENWLSNNLIYLIQKRNDIYSIYNLVGYNEPSEFVKGFPEHINQSSICDFEFLNDTLFIFTTNKNEPIIALNLQEISMLVENISDASSTYEVEYEKLNLLGNNEGVLATFVAKITIWYFQNKFTKSHQEAILVWMQQTKTQWNCLFLIQF